MKAKQLKLQPLTLIVESLLDIQAYYVGVDEVKYSTDSMLEAIDLNLKIFYVFDCSYPSDSKALWQFFQTDTYEIFTPDEKLTVQNRFHRCDQTGSEDCLKSVLIAESVEIFDWKFGRNSDRIFGVINLIFTCNMSLHVMLLEFFMCCIYILG